MKYFRASISLVLIVLLATVVACGAVGCKPRDVEACTEVSVVGDHVFVNCPVCGTTGQWTGRTKIIDAKTWYVMKCVRSHTFLSKTAS